MWKVAVCIVLTDNILLRDSQLPILTRLTVIRAGEALVLHADADKTSRWESLKATNPLLRSFGSMRTAYDESENPVVSSVRSVTDTIGGWFEESETAQVTKILRQMDPAFEVESFHRELREYIIPEVVDAYLTADQESLRAWCGEAVSS